MKPSGRVALALLLAGLPGVAAASCLQEIDYSVRGEFRRSTYVAMVKVTGVTWLDESGRPTRLRGRLMLGSIPGGFDPYIGAYYRVRLIEAFKGAPPPSFRIFSENTEARTPLGVGRSYLVFATRRTYTEEGVRLTAPMIDYCGNSRRAENAAPVVAALRKLTGSR